LILLVSFEHGYAAVFALSLLMLARYVKLLVGDRIPLADTAQDRRTCASPDHPVPNRGASGTIHAPVTGSC